MRKLFTSVVATVVVALGLFVASPLTGSVAHPQPVSACGTFTHEAWTPYGTGNFISTYTGGTDTVYIIIEALNDGCGYRRYAFSMWTAHGTPLTYQIRGRIWVCGNIVSNIVFNGSYINVGPWYYGNCSRQADTWYNGYSNGSGNYDANGTTNVYTNF